MVEVEPEIAYMGYLLKLLAKDWRGEDSDELMGILDDLHYNHGVGECGEADFRDGARQLALCVAQWPKEPDENDPPS